MKTAHKYLYKKDNSQPKHESTRVKLTFNFNGKQSQSMKIYKREKRHVGSFILIRFPCLCCLQCSCFQVIISPNQLFFNIPRFISLLSSYARGNQHHWWLIRWNIKIKSIRIRGFAYSLCFLSFLICLFFSTAHILN